MGVNTDVSDPFFFYKGFGMGEEASGQSFALMDLGYADSVEGKIRLIIQPGAVYDCVIGFRTGYNSDHA